MKLYIMKIEAFEKNGCCTEGNKHKQHHEAGQYLLQHALGRDVYEQAQFAAGEHGKPYMVDSSLYYNISHSGSYVVLVIGNTELGVDLQRKEGKRLEALAKRFFTIEEWQALCACETDEAREALFFYIWCRKEAYGKYLGVGLSGDVLKTNILQEIEDCCFLEYDGLAGYQISICCGKEEKIEETICLFEGL